MGYEVCVFVGSGNCTTPHRIYRCVPAEGDISCNQVGIEKESLSRK